MFSCFVPGEPSCQSGMRPVPVGGRTVLISVGSKGFKSWRKACSDMFAITAKQSGLLESLDGPLKTHLLFIMPRLKKHDKGATLWAETALDADKLERAVNDSLKTSGVIKDDARICFTIRVKRHCQPHETPGVIVRVSQLPREYNLIEMEPQQ